MKVDADLVRDVALLAQLQIPEDKLEATMSDLNEILELADKLQAIDTQNIPPMANPLDATQRLRPDQVTESDHRDLYQACAPEVEAGYFLVPRVVE